MRNTIEIIYGDSYELYDVFGSNFNDFCEWFQKETGYNVDIGSGNHCEVRFDAPDGCDIELEDFNRMVDEYWSRREAEKLRREYEMIRTELFEPAINTRVIIRYSDTGEIEIVPDAFLSDVSWSGRNRDYEVLANASDIISDYEFEQNPDEDNDYEISYADAYDIHADYVAL
jgi:hypothetical protein